MKTQAIRADVRFKKSRTLQRALKSATFTGRFHRQRFADDQNQQFALMKTANWIIDPVIPGNSATAGERVIIPRSLQHPNKFVEIDGRAIRPNAVDFDAILHPAAFDLDITGFVTGERRAFRNLAEEVDLIDSAPLLHTITFLF